MLLLFRDYEEEEQVHSA